MTAMQLQLTGLSMVYPNGKKALQNINLSLTSPNLIGLLGPNGAGKTTLMKLLTNALHPTDGTITFNGKPLTSSERELKSHLGYLPQSFGLFDELTVYEFLDYMSALKGIPNSKPAIERVLADTNLLPQRKLKIRTLSGGQRQRVGIAQALLGNPELLILDEPTVGLDPEERVSFRNLFSETARNKLVLLSTHIIEDVQSVCNRFIVLGGGKILFDGKPEGLISAVQGHVGIIPEEKLPAGCKAAVTSRIHTASGVKCHIVAGQLPDFAVPAEPTLEDAYLYLMEKEGGKL